MPGESSPPYYEESLGEADHIISWSYRKDEFVSFFLYILNVMHIFEP